MDQQIKNYKRRENTSSESQQSERSVSFQELILINLYLGDHLDNSEEETADQHLKQMLSVRSVISTASSLAHRMEEGQILFAEDQKESYRRIGAGSCGTIYEKLGSASIVKLARPGVQALWNDYAFHCDVWHKFKNFKQLHEKIRIPEPMYFVKPDDKEGAEWWDKRLKCFPDTPYPVDRTEAIVAERIFPMPKQVRNAIIEKWCPEKIKEAAKSQESNRNCLIRVLLGKAQVKSKHPSSMFSLQNYPLWVDKVQELEAVEYEDIAISMGGALAALHWSVGTDARDVEFVLGSAPLPKKRIPTRAEVLKMGPSTTKDLVMGHDSKRRVIQLWLLDFNQCREMERNETGLQLAVNAFFANDPYYPRPLTETSFRQKLWTSFKKGYLDLSNEIMAGESDPDVKTLPARFLEMLVNAEQTRKVEQAAKEAKRMCDY
ncbi:hypothetical protein FKW77_010179 [Venturia effusa]|uniref:DUF3669 domain-containing protein n=1 Tax=Venturia effusa TaxID=50376 RepID=A0A517L8B5_9PEZI|nr:hypothetical protein FKW77_010179 [Venturia effusa]